MCFRALKGSLSVHLYECILPLKQQRIVLIDSVEIGLGENETLRVLDAHTVCAVAPREFVMGPCAVLSLHHDVSLFLISAALAAYCGAWRFPKIEKIALILGMGKVNVVVGLRDVDTRAGKKQ